MSSSTIDHWAAVEQIIYYLKTALGGGILYRNHEHDRIEYFTDADWVGSKEDKRSTKSY